MSTVLVIEDSEHIRRLIQEILEADGFTIIVAESGVRGLQMAIDRPPACIVLDLILPDISGVQILKDLLTDRPRVPVIIVTAHMQDSVRNRCLELGAAAIVNKPFSRDELLYAVRSVLSSSQKRSQ